MATELFDLYATLTLSVEEFDKKVNEALESGSQLRDELDKLGNPPVNVGVDPNGNVFAAIIDDADIAKKSVSELADSMDASEQVKKKAEETSPIMEGFASATSQVIEDAIQGIIDFGKESIEAAASTGSELANAYLKAEEQFDMTMNHIQVKIGEPLMNIKTQLMNMATDLFGPSDAEMLGGYAEMLEAYSTASAEEIASRLESAFSLFENIEPVDAASIGEMGKGLYSQIDFWKEYGETLASVKQMNIDPAFLSQIADGSAESLETLKALEGAEPAELDALRQAYQDLETTRNAAAEEINAVQLQVDDTVNAITTSMAELAAGMDQSEAARMGATNTGAAVVEALEAQYPNIAAWVDSINAKLATVGQGGTGVKLDDPNNPYGNNWHNTGKPKGAASGLPYVPYNEYPASLHAGEAVLTRQEAESWRGGRGGSADPEAIAGAVAQAVRGALDGAAVMMSGRAVGNLVTDTVSRNIARDARRKGLATV